MYGTAITEPITICGIADSIKPTPADKPLLFSALTLQMLEFLALKSPDL
jgi:hypothetical protein